MEIILNYVLHFMVTPKTSNYNITNKVKLMYYIFKSISCRNNIDESNKNTFHLHMSMLKRGSYFLASRK